MKYYKVVRRNMHNGLTSVIIYGTNCVNYKIGKFSHGNDGTKLFVFDSLENAVDFKYNNCSSFSKIYECKIKGKIYRPKKIVMLGIFSHELIEKFWKSKKSKKKSDIITIIPPRGTLCVDAVKLIKEVG